MNDRELSDYDRETLELIYSANPNFWPTEPIVDRVQTVIDARDQAEARLAAVEAWRDRWRLYGPTEMWRDLVPILAATAAVDGSSSGRVPT